MENDLKLVNEKRKLEQQQTKFRSEQIDSASYYTHNFQQLFKTMIEEAGFRQVTYENLTMGVVAIHSGFKI